jgi:alpha-amylase
VDPDDRNKRITDPYEIDAWLGFDFPGRGEKYSSQKYHWYHFSGTDFNAANNKTAIYEIVGDRGLGGWAKSGDVDGERGNYDFLMYADLEYAHPEVKDDVLNWGKFLANEIPLQGIRFDAIKHFSEDFLRSFITQMDETYNEGWFFVGEFWKDSLGDMSRYLERMGTDYHSRKFNQKTDILQERSFLSSMHHLCTISRNSVRLKTRI